MKKTCPKCKNEYPATLEFFHKNKNGRYGLAGYCKSCANRNTKDWRQENLERVRESDRLRNNKRRDYRRNYMLQYSHDNKEKLRENKRNYYQQNRERFDEYMREWKERNRDKYNEQQRQYYADNPWVRINRSIKSGVYRSLLGGKNGHRWEQMVGYNLGELMNHLESQFARGMSFENYGEWHVDHIRPVADFKFGSVDDPEFKECWSLWNLQPLWGVENMGKGPKCEQPPLPLLHQEAN